MAQLAAYSRRPLATGAMLPLPRRCSSARAMPWRGDRVRRHGIADGDAVLAYRVYEKPRADNDAVDLLGGLGLVAVAAPPLLLFAAQPSLRARPPFGERHLADAMIPALSLCKVSVMRGRTHAVRSVTLSVAASGWFGLIGANGSGKTSLLRAIGGRLKIASGRLELLGVDATDADRRRADLIGFAPEPAMLPDILSARDVLALSRRCRRGVCRARVASRCLEIDALTDRQSHAVLGHAAAGGVACAFARERGIVILDEPFNWPIPSRPTTCAPRCAHGSMRATCLTALPMPISARLRSCGGLTDGALALERQGSAVRAAHDPADSSARQSRCSLTARGAPD